MAITEVYLYDSALAENYSSANVVQYTETYQVLSNDKEERPWTVVNAAGIPTPRQKFNLYSVDLFVISRVPRRAERDSTRLKWYVDIVYENNHSGAQGGGLQDDKGSPVSTPDQAVKEVSIDYEEVAGVTQTATLHSITANGPAGAPGVTALSIPSWLSGRTTQLGELVNSSGAPMPQPLTAYRKVITVMRYQVGYDAGYEDYLGKANSDEITLTEIDQFGTRYTETFPPETLLMKNIVKENVWMDGTLYYRLSFIMDNIAGELLVSFQDAGLYTYVATNQLNPKTNVNYTASEIDGILGYESPVASPTTIKFLTAVDTDKDGDKFAGFVSDPFPLNGAGNVEGTWAAAGDPTANKNVHMNYNVLETIAFLPLNL